MKWTSLKELLWLLLLLLSLHLLLCKSGHYLVVMTGLSTYDEWSDNTPQVNHCEVALDDGEAIFFNHNGFGVNDYVRYWMRVEVPPIPDDLLVEDGVHYDECGYDKDKWDKLKKDFFKGEKQ